MGGTGFEKVVSLLFCKFAEGDSRILLREIACGRRQFFGKRQVGAAVVKVCMVLGKVLCRGARRLGTSTKLGREATGPSRELTGY